MMQEKDVGVPAWFGRADAARIRFHLRPVGAARRFLMEIDTGRSGWIDADGVTALRDLCNEFLAAAEEKSE